MGAISLPKRCFSDDSQKYYYYYYYYHSYHSYHTYHSGRVW